MDSYKYDKIELVRFLTMPYHSNSFALETSDVIGFTSGQRTAIEMQVGISIVSRGPQVYDNFEYPRYRNFFGYAQIMSGEFVVQSIPLQFLNQEILHWRDIVFGLTETIGCYFKLYGSLDDPEVVINTASVKTRQRFTGVRVRLQPGVLANISLTWEEGNALCGGQVNDPDPNQGNPSDGNNETYQPGDRPSYQTGDPDDPTANDGNYDPTDGLEPPPGDPANSATWKVGYFATNGECVSYSGTFDTLVTSPTAVITVLREPTGGPPLCGKTDMRLVILSNGSEINRTLTGGDIVSTSIYRA